MSCADSQNLKKGNGVTTQFNFDFPYNKQSDVNVSLLNQTTEKWDKTSAWTWANATTIEFDTAPPTPNPDVANIKIWRLTSVEPLDAVFNPGSAIRAEDLNSNFEQLQFAAEEARCSSSDLVDGGIDLENLGDVEIGNIQDGQIIEWDGTNWVNTDWHQSDWADDDENSPGFIQNKPDAFGTTYLGTRNCVDNGPTGDEPAGGFYVNTAGGTPDAGWNLPAGTQLGVNDRIIKLDDGTWSVFGVGNNVVASDTPPPSALGGDLWWDSGSTTALYFFYVDDDGGQWVPATPSGGQVGSDDITNGSITTDKIADGAVTPAKLSTGGPNWNTDGDVNITRSLFLASDDSAISLGGAPENGVEGVTIDTNQIQVTPDSGGVGITLRNEGSNVPTVTLSGDGKATFKGQVNNTSGGYKFPDGSVQTTASAGSGGTVINYQGASAWGVVNGDSTLLNGFNVTSGFNNDPGQYQITFNTPMPNDLYSVVANVNAAASLFICVITGQTENGFIVRVLNNSGAVSNCSFNFAVHSSNAIAPQYGVGADAWGYLAPEGALRGGYNVASVTRTSTGQYEVTFTTPMPNENYSLVFGGLADVVVEISRTASSFRYSTVNSSNAPQDFASSFTVFASSTVTPTYTWTRDGTTLKPANAGDTVAVDGSATFTGAVSAPNACTAWVNFSGGNGVVRDAFNVNGPVTRVDAGRYTVEFATAMDNSNYCVQVASNQLTTIIDNITKESFGMSVFDGGGSRVDTTVICATVYGGKD